MEEANGNINLAGPITVNNDDMVSVLNALILLRLPGKPR